MSGVEALARVLCTAEGIKPDWPVSMTGGRQQWELRAGHAERILADPGPLLAALAEAGVLREEAAHGSWDPDESAWIVWPNPSPHRAPMRRYVTEWRPADE